MALVYVKNKKYGTTYVYESTDYWVKEKQQSRKNNSQGVSEFVLANWMTKANWYPQSV